VSEQVSPYGESLTLDFKGHPIRALMIKGVPHMALPDILDACGYNERAAEYVNSSGFPTFGKHAGTEAPDAEVAGEPQDLVLLSPTGVYYWAMGLSDPNRVTGFTAWARRESKRLCPCPAAGDPAFYLTLASGTDGWTHVPPGPPSKYSGWKSEWQDLKWADYIAWKDAESRNVAVNRKRREEARSQVA